MEGKNPFSDLVEETKKGPKTIEQRRKEAEEALKNKNICIDIFFSWHGNNWCCMLDCWCTMYIIIA